MSDTVALTQGLPSHIGPGVTIGGKYLLEAEIGRGSMGTVYRAVHATLGQRVAIKLISFEHSQSPEARRRFSVEAKAAAKLRSRHVVQVYDDGETPEGNPYIVLEYLEGETLEQRLERDHDLPLGEAVRVASHAGRALARAHAQGIVHRDLKPANVFLVRTDEDELGWIAKVLDFGIAKLENQGEKGTTQAGTVLGTPLFMSPEQVRGASSVDHRADLYSLGMCLFHMLTGEFAFYAPHYSDILIGICTEPLPSLRAKAPWLPEAMERWFQRACAKEPLERFQSADEMIEALSAAAGTAAGGLSKHKSVPEGRIAPETLVGYATPALATLHPDTAAASARTQVLSLPTALSGTPGPDAAGTGRTPSGHAAPPVPIVIGAGEARSASGDWSPPVRSLKPLFIGVGLGLLALATVAGTLVALGDDDEKEIEGSPGAVAAPPVPAAASPAVAPATTATTEPAPAALESGSSVAAEPPPPPAANQAKATPKARSPSAPPAPRPKPPPPRSPGSDLGF